MNDQRIRSIALQQIVDEIADATAIEALGGGSGTLAIVAEAILDRLCLPHRGKANVKFDIDLEDAITTTVILTWPEDKAEEN